MDEIGVFTPEQARLIWQDYQTRRQLQPHVSQNYPQRRPVDEVSPHRVFVKNSEAETIPAYACMRITGTEVVGGRTALTVEKPTDIDGEFVFNSQFAIAANAVGWAYRYGVVVMLGDGETPTAANAQYVPMVGEWTIEEGGGPFIVFGEHNAADDALIGRFAGGSGSGSGSGSGCPCTCIEDGDIEVEGIITTSIWTVAMSAVRFVQAEGTITFPAGTYTLTWDSGTSTWTLDIGGDLTAAYNDDSDATADVTMDGTLTMSWTGGVAEIKLCVDGTIPAP